MSTIKTPFQIAPSGRVAHVLDQNIIARQQILDVLVTSKFERTMRAGYGAGANDLMYEPVDDLIFSEFKVDAMMELSKQVRIAAITDLYVAPLSTPYFADGEDTSLEISVYYRTGSPGVQLLTFSVVSPDTLTEES
jgi:phage baseplate assembly protein W